MLMDAMVCLVSSFDPILDHYAMLQFGLLFPCVGRWSTPRPTLDAGVSSVLLLCLFTLSSMLGCCLLLSCILAPCMFSGVWPPWQLLLSSQVPFYGCMLVYMGICSLIPLYMPLKNVYFRMLA